MGCASVKASAAPASSARETTVTAGTARSSSRRRRVPDAFRRRLASQDRHNHAVPDGETFDLGRPLLPIPAAAMNQQNGLASTRLAVAHATSGRFQ